MKGIKKSVKEKSIRHEHFLKQLNQPTENYFTNRRLQAQLHQIHLLEVEKRGLCAYDDKRFFIEGSFNTLAYGNHMIENIIEEEPY